MQRLFGVLMSLQLVTIKRAGRRHCAAWHVTHNRRANGRDLTSRSFTQPFLERL
jgi:hypothetical protein